MNTEEESLEYRQKHEIAALQAIYLDDFLMVNAHDTENVSPDPVEFVLCLKPHQGSTKYNEVHATINIRFKLSETYPESSPTIQLEKGHGVSLKDIENLKKELEDLCDNGRGEEIGLVLAQHVQGFLAEKNKKPRFQSFHEEMVVAQQIEKERNALEKKSRMVEENNQQLMALEEEIKQKQPAFLIDLMKNRNKDVNTESLQQIPENNNLEEAVKVLVTCTLPKPLQIDFGNKYAEHVYDCGPCLGQCQPNRHVLSAVETKLKAFAVITHFKVPCLSNLDSCTKQISAIEQEFRHLLKIRHPNLVSYLAFKWEMLQDFLHIYIAEEFVSGVSLNFYINRNFRVDVDILRHITDGVIQALNVLHKSNLVHKNIRPSSIYIDKSSQIRLTDYCLESKISEIFSITEERPSLTMYPLPPGRGGKRGDIHRLGLLIWTLFQGNVIHEWDHLKLPSSMPLSLQDLVKKCLDLDSKSRHLTIEDLVSHSFIKTPIRGSIKERVSRNDEEHSDFRSSPHPSQALTTSATFGSFPSRLLCEFETMQFLGSGGFGDVLKVRNNLDGNIYAIKRILLDRKSRQLNKKITREVKLLSRLNHENIVRYYNSWIETAQASEPSMSSEATQANSSAPDSPAHSKSLWFNRSQDSDSSGGVEFEEDSDAVETSSSLESSIEDTVDSPSVSQGPTSLQFMYIQMEYCEKSTLRTAIDSDLFCDKIRIWRLFREIVEGLFYIHQQGVIHRDLKPVNIFLDCDDHVKIGDFGLATAKISNQSGTPTDFVDGVYRIPHSDKSSELASGSEHFIGTALYVAPELKTCGKPVYNEKVDVYSLGIIFFEMCHPPLNTGMERIKVLSSIRQPNFVLPDGLTAHEAEVIVWLLNHNPTIRPSSTEILQSPYLPPLQMEDAELQEMVRHTLSNTQSKAYKHLVASCLQQKMSKLEEIVYDIDIITSTGFHQSAMIGQTIVDVFTKHCQRRGAIPFETPTLTPKVSDGVKQYPSSVQLMTQAGGVVTLPMDLQTPFARYIGRSKITWLKRFDVSKIYSEEKGSRTIHPKCSSELTFDIVTPSPASVLSDAEVITTISNILHDHRLRINRPLSLQIGHRLLLEAILIHCGIDEDKRKDVCHILKVCSKSESHIRSRASKLALSTQSIEMLLPFLEMEGTAAKMKSSLSHLLNTKEESASLAAQALDEIDVIMARAEDMGLKSEFTVVIDLAIQHYNIYSGLVFHFIDRPKSRKNTLIEVIATGGRYDDLVASFRNQSNIKFINRISHGQPIIKMENDVVSPPCAVGAVIHLDKLTSIVKESCSKEEAMVVSVVICSVGHRPLSQEKAWLVRDLWNSGITATTMDHLQSIEELQLWCKERNVPHIVQLKDSEAGYCRLRTWEKDRYTERKMSNAELIETLTNNSKPENCDSSFGCSRQNLTHRSNSLSESTGNSAVLGSSGASGPGINFHFTLDDKIPVYVKRRYQTQISKHLQSTLQNFTNRAQVEVVAIEATSAVIQSLLIALYVDSSDSKAVEKAKEIVAEKHKRQRKYLERIYDHLFHLKFEKSVTVLIIYGLLDNSHRLLM